MTYDITGIFYDKRKDKPYRGSIIYTLVKWGLLGILCLVVIGLVAKLGWYTINKKIGVKI